MSFLSDSEYTSLIKQTITEVANEYNDNTEVDAVLLWDIMKMQIRSTSLKYAKQKRGKIRLIEKNLESDIMSLRRKLEENDLSETSQTIRNTLEAKKLQLENNLQRQTQGAIIRSKARWHNEGEKNTKYFLSLEKRHVNSKTIKQLQLENNSAISMDMEILTEAKCFYQNLYTSRAPDISIHDEFFFPEGSTAKLDEHAQKEGEGSLTKEECLNSLKTMASDKTPGTDGLPAEFYKVFWGDIEDFLLDALNCTYEKGCLSVSQRRGIMTLLPKKNKPVNLLKNWRPITLLNCDYKIAAKSIANRIKKFLPNIINSDQTGFLKNRFIGENIRLIDGIINHMNTEQIPGLLLFVDFEKALDNIEWPFIDKTLRHFNFGTSLVSWVKLFYTKISSCVLNNKWASNMSSLCIME